MVVYKGLWCIKAGHVPHIDYAYFEAISKSNMLVKFDRNWKKLRVSYKKLYDIKCVIFALNCTVVVYKGLWCIEAGRVPHIDYVYFEAISKAICWWRLIETEGASATRYLSPLLGKTELSIMSYRKHVSSSGHLSLTIEIRQEMYFKVFFQLFYKGPKSTFDFLCNNRPKSMKFVSSSHFIKYLTYNWNIHFISFIV